MNQSAVKEAPAKYIVEPQANAESLITQHMDLWTSAISRKNSTGRGSNQKYELYGIKKLRELILELAVRGKLVPQDPNDEPASELLTRISQEKTKLAKESGIKISKNIPEIPDEEKPFGLPAGWEWERLGNILNVLNGRAYKKHEMLRVGTPLLRVGNLFTSREWYYSDLDLEPEKYIDSGDLIYAWSASFGPFIWNGGKAIYHYHIWKLDIFRDDLTTKEYLYNYLLEVTESIKASGNGIAMIHMTKERMEKLPIPIAPLKEQHRIVAKVDELMVLCDQLENQTEQSLDSHATLADTLLDALTRAQSAAELAENWQRLEANWDTLFPTTLAGERAIDKLKQTILQLAVMGKLVPQDPNDEPASELLERIAAEKEQLIKNKKIKKQKPLPPIGNDEKPFNLPDRWEWVRLGDLSYVFSGNSFRSQDFNEESGVRAIRITNAGVGELVETNDFLPEVFSEDYSGYVVHKGDLILALTRPYISTGLKISVCPESYDGALLNQRVAAIRPIVKTDFLYYFMKSGFVLGLYQRRFGGSGLQPNLKMADVTDLVVPWPPTVEQKHIVAKVDELMTLCDQLKERLQTAQETQQKFTDAAVAEALS